MSPVILLLILVIARASPVKTSSTTRNIYSEKIVPKVDFGTGNTWAVRFQLSNKQLKNMCNARLTVPTDLISLYTESLNLSVEIQFLLNDQPLSQMGSIRVSNFKNYTDNNEKSYVVLQKGKMERAKSNLLRSVAEYRDQMSDYKPAENLYLELSTNSHCSSKIQSRRSKRAIDHARSKRSARRQNNSDYCRQFELYLNIAKMYPDLKAEPKVLNVGTCINPHHKMHPRNTDRAMESEERENNLRQISERQCFSDYDAMRTNNNKEERFFSYRNLKEYFISSPNAESDFSRSIIPAQCFPNAYGNASVAMVTDGSSQLHQFTMKEVIITSCGCH